MSFLIDEQISCSNIDDTMCYSYIKFRLNGETYEFPNFNVSGTDYNKSSNCGLPLDSKIFQYHVDQTLSNVQPLTNMTRQKDIIKKFNKHVDKFKPDFSNINFYFDGCILTQQTRNIILDIQQNLPIPFLNDIELNSKQSLNSFQEQIEYFKSYNSSRIKCPSLSVRMPYDLFTKKLDYLLLEGFKRINLEWGGDATFADRWRYVTQKTKTNRILFNVVGILRRSTHKPNYSNVMKCFQRGVHSCGLGFRLPPKDTSPLDKKKWLFDTIHDNYNIVDSGNPDSNDVISHNLLHNKILGYHESIKNQTLFIE